MIGRLGELQERMNSPCLPDGTLFSAPWSSLQGADVGLQGPSGTTIPPVRCHRLPIIPETGASWAGRAESVWRGAERTICVGSNACDKCRERLRRPINARKSVAGTSIDSASRQCLRNFGRRENNRQALVNSSSTCKMIRPHKDFRRLKGPVKAIALYVL